MQAAERKIWLEEQKQSLRASDCQAVIRALQSLSIEQNHSDEHSPVGAAIHYLEKRPPAHPAKAAQNPRRMVATGTSRGNGPTPRPAGQSTVE
jgi:hypothetical protein